MEEISFLPSTREAVGNRRIDSDDKEDRISELPDSLIQHILSFLPSTRDAVRTGVLSKRWQHQWTHVPVLIFICPPNSGEEHLSFVESTLILHDCPKIKKFHLQYSHGLVPDSEFTAKIRFAINKCVEELILIFRDSTDLHMLPLFVFDNASLVRLEIVECPFKRNCRVNLPSLKSLKLVCGGDDLTDDFSGVIENILSGCPLLECFEFYGYNMERVAIVSKSLKVLRLEYIQADHIVEVSCPNLEKLDMLSWGHEVIKVVNLPSSVCVTLDIGEYDNDDLLRVLLEQFQHVNKITMGWICFKSVSDAYGNGYQSLPQLNHKCLTVNVGDFLLAIPGIAYALHSPRLESLVVKFTSKSCKLNNRELQDLMISRSDYWNTHESSGLSCLVSHLETVEIIGLRETDNNCKFELEFIEFVLKKAQVLKKMTVLLQKSRKYFVTEFSQKLLSFPRCSQGANVELLCST